MTDQANLGASLIVVLGGLLHGSFALPMKRITKWKWENTWLVYSVVAMILFPGILAMLTVPGAANVYASAPLGTLGAVALFGFGWGVGSTLFGLGIARVGMALAFAMILGITSAVGSLLPLFVFDPAGLWTPKGYTLMAGLAIVIVGITVCARAGAMRDRDLDKAGAADEKKQGFATGLLICIASGVLSPMLNVGFAVGNRVMPSNATWVPALAGGFLANAGYALYLLRKNKSWPAFTAPGVPAWYWLGATAMGLMWYGGISIYGKGAEDMGRYGAVLGWPIFMSIVIVTANLLGAFTGEWKGASQKARWLSWLGIAILIAAIVVVSQA